MLVAIVLGAVSLLTFLAGYGVYRDGRLTAHRIVVTRGAGKAFASARVIEWASSAAEPVAPRSGAEERSRMQPRLPSDLGSAKPDEAPVSLGRAAAAVDGGIGAAESWFSVDPAVFDAASQAAHAPINNLLDLAPVAHLDTWANATEGMRASLAGHVGEFLAQGHLQDVGLAAHMATMSNQQGWDATIGNVHVNFKDYANFHSPGIAHHFAANPSVPVIMPADAAHLPTDALHVAPGQHLDPSQLADHHVVVLDAWHHADAAAAMQHAYDQLDPTIALHHAVDLAAGGHLLDAAGAAGAHIPIATLLLSAHREARLLVGGNIDAIDAVKNLAVDVGGVMGGAAIGHGVGMAAGAVLGAHFPPAAAHAVVFGGEVGRIAGAIVGKELASGTRNKPFKDAKKRYEQAHKEMAAATTRAEEGAVKSWNDTWQRANEDYYASLIAVVATYDEFASEQRRKADLATHVSAASFAAAVERARESVAVIDPSTIAVSGWRALPGASTIRRFAAVHQLRRDLKRWDEFAETATLLGDSDGLADALAAIPAGQEELSAFVARGLAGRTETYAAVATAAEQTQMVAINLRSETQNRLDAEWENLREEMATTLTEPAKTLRRAEKQLNKELHALGKDPIDFSAAPEKATTEDPPNEKP